MKQHSRPFKRLCRIVGRFLFQFTSEGGIHSGEVSSQHRFDAAVSKVHHWRPQVVAHEDVFLSNDDTFISTFNIPLRYHKARVLKRALQIIHLFISIGFSRVIVEIPRVILGRIGIESEPFRHYLLRVIARAALALRSCVLRRYLHGKSLNQRKIRGFVRILG